ncbi:MAG TPA: DUF4062 domain-containing protein, partial [bacterium]|nr:DUF4062 domain-containing protein [bacterium]
MKKKKIFISSVQAEFKKEREMLFDYITNDPLLERFFEPFIFENLPATDISASDAYIKNVEESDIYLGIFGKDYGYEDKEGISPTEREFDYAKLHSKTKLVFLSNNKISERHPKEVKLIKKAEQFVVRKQFSSTIELKAAVYASLVRYLEENEYIRTVPFDAEFNKKAEFDDLDSEKIRSFIRTARGKRKFPF